MSTHQYSRSFTNGGWDLDINISQDVEAMMVGKIFTISCDENIVVFTFEEDLDVNEESTLDGVVDAYRSQASDRILNFVKQDKFNLIDKRTNELINQGFQFAGKTFSLTHEAQHKLTNFYNLRDDVSLLYPIKFNTKDDNDFYEAQDSSDISNMYAEANSVIRIHVDSGTALKDQVRGATSKVEVDAVMDDR